MFTRIDYKCKYWDKIRGDAKRLRNMLKIIFEFVEWQWFLTLTLKPKSQKNFYGPLKYQ